MLQLVFSAGLARVWEIGGTNICGRYLRSSSFRYRDLLCRWPHICADIAACIPVLGVLLTVILCTTLCCCSTLPPSVMFVRLFGVPGANAWCHVSNRLANMWDDGGQRSACGMGEEGSSRHLDISFGEIMISPKEEGGGGKVGVRVPWWQATLQTQF